MGWCFQSCGWKEWNIFSLCFHLSKLLMMHRCVATMSLVSQCQGRQLKVHSTDGRTSKIGSLNHVRFRVIWFPTWWHVEWKKGLNNENAKNSEKKEEQKTNITWPRGPLGGTHSSPQSLNAPCTPHSLQTHTDPLGSLTHHISILLINSPTHTPLNSAIL